MAAPKLKSIFMARDTAQAVLRNSAGPVKIRGRTQEQPNDGTEKRTSHVTHTKNCLTPCSSLQKQARHKARQLGMTSSISKQEWTLTSIVANCCEAALEDW